MPSTALLLSDPILAALAERAGVTDGPRSAGQRSLVARTALDRYFALLASELPALRETFTGAESRAIAGACNGWASAMEPGEMLLNGLRAGEREYTILGAHVEDSIRWEGLAEMHEIDGPALVEKLNNLSRAQVLALLDAVERWWADEARDPEVML